MRRHGDCQVDRPAVRIRHEDLVRSRLPVGQIELAVAVVVGGQRDARLGAEGCLRDRPVWRAPPIPRAVGLLPGRDLIVAVAVVVAGDEYVTWATAPCELKWGTTIDALQRDLTGAKAPEAEI